MRMRNDMKILLFAIVLTIFGGYLSSRFAYSQEPTKYEQYQQIGTQALEWIAENVEGYTYHIKKLPDVEFMTPQELWAQVMPNTPYDSSQDFYAVYSNLGYIIINGEIDLTTTFGQSVVVHELVHYYQHYNNRQFECRGAKEKEAYEAQEKWLTERNVNIWDHLDRLYTVTMFRCTGFGFY